MQGGAFGVPLAAVGRDVLLLVVPPTNAGVIQALAPGAGGFPFLVVPVCCRAGPVSLVAVGLVELTDLAEAAELTDGDGLLRLLCYHGPQALCPHDTFLETIVPHVPSCCEELPDDPLVPLLPGVPVGESLFLRWGLKVGRWPERLPFGLAVPCPGHAGFVSS